MPSEDFPEQMQKVADMLNSIADELGPFMTAFRDARTAMNEPSPADAAHPGSSQAHDPAVGSGYMAVEAARLRMINVLREPWDDFPNPT